MHTPKLHFLLVAVIYTSPFIFSFEPNSDVHILEEAPDDLSFHRPTTIPQVSKPSRCGQVKDCLSGSVMHKLFENVVENERCVWVLAAPQATDYDINILYLSPVINQMGYNITLTFSGVRHNRTKPQFTTYLPSDNETFRVTQANIVIITFYSTNFTKEDERSSKGFYLQYEALTTGNITKTQGTHHLISMDSITQDALFQYPEAGTYRNWELASILILPSDNLYSEAVKSIGYLRGSLEKCRDSLYLYRFHTNASHYMAKWQLSARFCDDAPSQLITFQDILLMLFQTDGSATGNGFSLFSKSNMNENCP